MGRKHFQDLANVMCRKFVECSTNPDLVDLAIFGDGVLELFITEDRATHNGYPVEPLPIAGEWLAWAEDRLEALRIPREEMRRAVLRVEYTVVLARISSLKWLNARFQFACTGLVESVDRQYKAELSAQTKRGLSQVSPSRRARGAR